MADQEEEVKLTVEPNIDSVYNFGDIGKKLQKRLPLKQPYEKKLQDHISGLRKRIQLKIEKYSLEGADKVKLRKYQREMWAIIGMQDRGLEF